LYFTSALFAFSIICLYLITIIFDTAAIKDLAIPLPVIIVSSVSLIFSASLLLIKNEKNSKLFATIDFILMLTSIGMLVFFTDKFESPFIGLIAILSIFSGVYGAYGVVSVLILIGILTSAEYLDNRLTFQVVSSVILIGIIPMILSIYIWHFRKNNENNNTTIDKKNLRLSAQIEGLSSQSETIIKAIGDGVVSIDGRGIISMMNPAAENLSGWTYDDASRLNYKSIFQLLDNSSQPINESKDPIAKALNNNEQILDDDLALQTKNNKKIMVSLHISPIGQPGAGVIVVFRDITKAKAEETEQAEFISTASHEMRTPVAAIEGYIGLALNPETATLDERARSYVNKAHESLQHLGRLFKDLLDVSKIDDNRINYIPKVTNIMNLVEDIVDGLKAKANEKKLELIFLPKPDNSGRFVVPVYYVNLDPDIIREVVGNLIENAIKYSAAGNIEVNVVASDEKVKISVKDSGIGISEEDIPHLFQKFYRVNNSETNQIGGTGLGLYLSKKLTERLGGQITVASQYHKGSVFTIELPRIGNDEAKALIEVQKNEVTAIQKTSDTPKFEDILPPRPTYQNDNLSRLENKSQPSVESDKVKPATEVPRGESLSKEEILAKAKQLHEMAISQARPGAEISQNLQSSPKPIINSRISTVRIPTRNEN